MQNIQQPSTQSSPLTDFHGVLNRAALKRFRERRQLGTDISALRFGLGVIEQQPSFVVDALARGLTDEELVWFAQLGQRREEPPDVDQAEEEQPTEDIPEAPQLISDEPPPEPSELLTEPVLLVLRDVAQVLPEATRKSVV